MFKFTDLKELKWPVTVSVPRDGGKTVKATFTGHFVLLPQPEFDAVYADGGNDGDLLRRTFKGWEADFADESGAPVPVTDENMDRAIATPYLRAAIIRAYMELSQGREAARKN